MYWLFGFIILTLLLIYYLALIILGKLTQIEEKLAAIKATLALFLPHRERKQN